MIDWIDGKIYCILASLWSDKVTCFAKLFHKIIQPYQPLASFSCCNIVGLHRRQGDYLLQPRYLAHCSTSQSEKITSGTLLTIYITHKFRVYISVQTNVHAIIAQCHIWTPFQISQDPLYCFQYSFTELLIYLLTTLTTRGQTIVYTKPPTVDAYDTSDIRAFSFSVVGECAFQSLKWPPREMFTGLAFIMLKPLQHLLHILGLWYFQQPLLSLSVDPHSKNFLHWI